MKGARSVNLAAAVAVCIVLTGCSREKPVTFDPDFNENIVPFHEPLWGPDTTSYALGEVLRGHLFFEAGDRSHCDQRFSNAEKVMGQIAADEREGTAVALNEQLRTYRGSPYERSSLGIFRAICHYNSSDYSGALAACRMALASDQETYTDVKADKEDFCIAYVLGALCYARLGERDNAVQYLKRANLCVPGKVEFSPQVLDDNFIAVVGVGTGPAARQDALASKYYVAGECPEARVELAIGDLDAVKAIETTDLLAQAESNKGGEADAAAKGRAVGKFIMRVLLSALVGRDVQIEERRDLRCWWGLPRKFYIVSARVPPGLYPLAFRCYCAGGERLPRAEQVWWEYPISARPDRIGYFRLYQNAQNYHGLAPKPLDLVLAEKREAGKKQ